MVQRHVLLAAVGIDAARRLGGQAQQSLDGRRSLRARLQFDDLTQHGQRDDDDRRLEIDGDAAVGDERVGKHAGREGSDHAVNKGGAGA